MKTPKCPICCTNKKVYSDRDAYTAGYGWVCHGSHSGNPMQEGGGLYSSIHFFNAPQEDDKPYCPKCNTQDGVMQAIMNEGTDIWGCYVSVGGCGWTFKTPGGEGTQEDDKMEPGEAVFGAGGAYNWPASPSAVRINRVGVLGTDVNFEPIEETITLGTSNEDRRDIAAVDEALKDPRRIPWGEIKKETEPKDRKRQMGKDGKWVDGEPTADHSLLGRAIWWLLTSGAFTGICYAARWLLS